MNIREVLLERHSKEITSSVVHYIYKNPNDFKTLLTLYFSDQNPIIKQRASWVLGHIGVDFPEFVFPHLDELVDYFTIKGHHNAIYRNTTRFLQFIEIPTHLQGKVASTCFDLVMNPTTAIAIRAFSMTVLYNISNNEPDLKPELKIVLEDLLPYASKGEQGRAKKILTLLNKELH